MLHIISLYASTFVWEWDHVLTVSRTCPEFIDGNHSVLQGGARGKAEEKNNYPPAEPGIFSGKIKNAKF